MGDILEYIKSNSSEGGKENMSKLVDTKIDWTNFRVLNEYAKHTSYLIDLRFSENKTNIVPEQYFLWAKDDLLKNENNIDLKTRVSMVSNVKRCIDCKCETILKSLGYEKEINVKNYPKLKEYFSGDSSPIITLLSKILDLNMIVVEEIRKLRNNIEHDYEVPSVEDAKRAVSVAELFLLALNSKIGNLSCYIIVSSPNKEDEINIVLAPEGDDVADFNKIKIRINDKSYYPEDVEYFKLLQVLISHQFSKLPNILGYDIPLQYVKYKEYWDKEIMSLEDSCEEDIF